MPPPIPPKLELASNFRGESLLMWDRLGEVVELVNRRVDAPTLEPFWLRGGGFDPSITPRKTPFQDPFKSPIAVLDGTVRTTYKLYRRADPAIVVGDLFINNIPNIANDHRHPDMSSNSPSAATRGWNSKKVMARVTKTEDVTFYYKLTTFLDGVESVLAVSPVVTVLSAEETQAEGDHQAVRGIQRTFNETIADGTVSPAFHVVDFVIAMGTYARTVSIRNKGIGDIRFRPNNKNNLAITVPAGESFVYRRAVAAVFRLLFENTSGGAVDVEIVAAA